MSDLGLASSLSQIGTFPSNNAENKLIFFRSGTFSAGQQVSGIEGMSLTFMRSSRLKIATQEISGGGEDLTFKPSQYWG